MRILKTLAPSSLIVGVIAAPVAAQGPQVLEDIPTVVAVVDPAATPEFPAGSLMRADCAVAVRITAEDGSATEWMACELSQEPVEIPENQGSPPITTVTYGGGPCTWLSDYMAESEVGEVFAEDFEVTVTPSGRVFAWSSYPAQPLDCEPLAAPTEPTVPGASPDVVASPVPAATSSAAPAPTAEGQWQEAANDLCARASRPSVLELLGEEAVGSANPGGPTESDFAGKVRYGCSVYFSGASRIHVAVKDAVDWEDRVGSGYEPVEGIDGVHYDDILGLIWRPSGADYYISLAVLFGELRDHLQVLSLMFSSDG